MFYSLDKRFAKRSYAFVFMGMSCLLVSCSMEHQPRIEQPETWQAHLQRASLPLNFVPMIVETIYVPVYSHIYHEDNTRTTLLAGTLSIRNTDTKNSLILKSVAYYNTQGKLLQELCQNPVLLGAMATAEIVVPRTHTEGGSGAHFMIEWMAEKNVSEPLAEAIMISSGSAQDLSFVSRGVVVSRTNTRKHQLHGQSKHMRQSP